MKKPPIQLDRTFSNFTNGESAIDPDQYAYLARIFGGS